MVFIYAELYCSGECNRFGLIPSRVSRAGATIGAGGGGHASPLFSNLSVFTVLPPPLPPHTHLPMY